MPYREIFVPAEVAFECCDCIKIYHVYKDDDVDQGIRTFWYGLDPSCSEYEGTCFDVRDVASALGMPRPESIAQIVDVITKAIKMAQAGKANLCSQDFADCWQRRAQTLSDYYVDTREVYVRRYTVQAASEEEAINRVANGEGKVVKDVFEFVYHLGPDTWTASRLEPAYEGSHE